MFLFVCCLLVEIYNIAKEETYTCKRHGTSQLSFKPQENAIFNSHTPCLKKTGKCKACLLNNITTQKHHICFIYNNTVCSKFSSIAVNSNVNVTQRKLHKIHNTVYCTMYLKVYIYKFTTLYMSLHTCISFDYTIIGLATSSRAVLKASL